jgi:hypothetical protein
MRIGHLDPDHRLGMPLDQIAAAEVDAALLQGTPLRAGQHDGVSTLPVIRGHQDLRLRQGQEGVDQEVDVHRLQCRLVGERDHDGRRVVRNRRDAGPDQAHLARVVFVIDDDAQRQAGDRRGDARPVVAKHGDYFPNVALEQGLCGAPDHRSAANAHEELVAIAHPLRLAGGEQDRYDPSRARHAPNYLVSRVTHLDKERHSAAK